MIVTLIFLLFPICLVLAALTDLLEMTIPNHIPLALILGFLVVAPFIDIGWTGFGWHLAAGAVVFAACFALFAFGVMGGGDAKLLSAAALWFGFNESLLSFAIYVSYIGGLLTVLLILLRSRSSIVMTLNLPLPDSLISAKKVPYGIAIGIAGLIAYQDSPIVLWALSAGK
ncbi:A24 family peptidase [Rhizobium halophytocola]|uniref:Prepilin peptidase CpaA n=1 Tax=Rhizobium halophytocola TaxID=735519 RepID=A0ABS4E1G7_9HYPH|nr:prepilin peptidase [Rhizobium halophytocola]MBP1851749.1 prepilin peptidase CpaA [Rhizobium halophytocola]